MDFTTNILNTTQSHKDPHSATHVPIYSNAAFAFDTAEEMENAFIGRSPSHIYSRISNPTVEHFEQRYRAVTGALAVTALSTGMAAISNVLLTIARSGDTIITSKHLFGNTYSLLASTLKDFGINTRFVDLTNIAEVDKNIDSSTIAIFFETITNPQLEIANISDLQSIAKANKLLLIADTTMTPPNIFNAKKAGINIEVVSSTKIISGGATSLGGIIADYGNYDWSNNPKLKELAQKFGPFTFNAKLRKEVYRNLGACLSPYHAYLQSLGLETLALRFNKSTDNTAQLAAYLEKEKTVVSINYPGLQSSKYNKIGLEQFGNNPGSLLTFNLSTREACFVFLNKLKLIKRATNICDNRTLILHPASTIYCDFTPELRLEQGVPDTLIRLSVGIEDIVELISDIKQALQS